MAPASSKDAASAGKHASPLRARSASNADAPSKKPPPQRTNTAPNRAATEGATNTAQKSQKLQTAVNEKDGAPASGEPDTFETSSQADDPPEPPRASVDLDDLPIELIGLTDSFIESLQAKVHPTPPTIDTLSTKFQDFYSTASTHIATHLAALATRQNREQSPAPTNTTRASAASIFRAKAASISGRDKAKTPPPPPKSDSERQMITAAELADRKRQRRAQEVKRSLLEEAVERRLCEGIYHRIYRHRTTQDEAQDDKLRSKTAALDLVGIGPADLGIDLGEPSDASEATIAAKQQEVRQWLEASRKELVLMNETHYPLGKLNRLKAAHKGIVDTLSHFHPSASADEIMPMLIYTLITLPPQQLSVVSDLNFIQRFRWEPKIEGEAAYCLTNLEAAISFLETVDLSTLRADEAPSGPAKVPSVEALKTETFPPAYSPPGLTVSSPTPSSPEVSIGQATATAAAKPSPSPTAGLHAADPQRSRRLSDLVNTPAQALSTASGAVMNTFNAADQGLKTIGNSLEGSYRIFFGKLAATQQRDGQAGGPVAGTGDAAGAGSAEVLLPKTLDEARKLVGTPPQGSEDEASINGEEHGPQKEILQTTPPSQRQQQQQQHRRLTAGKDDRMLAMLAGRKPSRDHSADSSRSAASSRRVAFADEDGASTTSSTAAASSSTAAAASGAAAGNPALIDSMRNLGNSLNPMSRLSSIGSFRGFGRASTPAPVPPPPAAATADGGDLATAFPDIAAALPPKPQVAPPMKRFMELHNPADLRISEVMELLRDYRRLANALKDMGAFKE